jgi:hypothetical protein
MAYVMKSMPAVLSIGMHSMRTGYSFHWLEGQASYFVNPHGKTVRLTVVGDIPYLKPGDKSNKPTGLKEWWRSLPLPRLLAMHLLAGCMPPPIPLRRTRRPSTRTENSQTLRTSPSQQTTSIDCGRRRLPRSTPDCISPRTRMWDLQTV